MDLSPTHTSFLRSQIARHVQEVHQLLLISKYVHIQSKFHIHFTCNRFWFNICDRCFLNLMCLINGMFFFCFFHWSLYTNCSSLLSAFSFVVWCRFTCGNKYLKSPFRFSSFKGSSTWAALLGVITAELNRRWRIKQKIHKYMLLEALSNCTLLHSAAHTHLHTATTH